MICLVIRGRNCAKYIGKCLKSLRNQEGEWRAMVILDAPEDGAEKAVVEGGNVKVHLHKIRKGLGYNMWFGINKAIEAWKLMDEELIGILDADDKLLEKALRTVAKKYNQNPDLLLTHGSYVKKSKGRKTKVSREYPLTANVRIHPWRGSHFKTFKVKLFKHLPEECFKDEKGDWLEAASDLALMMPLMELAGLDRCKYIRKPIYEWRDNYSDSTAFKLQKHCTKIIRRKPKMERIEV